jgi:hypothetical protein
LAAFLPTGATADQNSILMAEWLNGQVRLKTKQPAGHVNGSLATDSLYDTGAGAYNTGTTAFALIPFAAGQEAHVALAATTLTPYYTVTSGVRNYVGTDDLNAIAGLAAIPAAAAPTADYTNDTIKILAYHLESNENVVTGPKSIAFIGRDLVNSEWWTRAAGNDIHTILEDRIPTAKYFETGVVRITNGVVNIGQAAAVQEPGGVPKVVTTDSQYYVDIVLINKTPAAKEFGSTLKSSFSGYIELEILPSSQYWNTKVNPPAISGTAPVAPATWGGMDGRNYYMYTKDRHGFNSWNTAEGKWNTGNDYVKKVSLKPGINEIRLSYFSQGEGDVEFK